MHTDISNPLNSRMFPSRCYWAPIHSSVTAGDSSRGNFGEFVQNPALTFRYANNSKLQNVKVELWLYFLFVCGFLVVLPLRAWTCISSLQGWEKIPKLLSVLTAAMEKLVCWFYSYNFTASPNSKPPLLSSSVSHRSKPALLSPAGSQPGSQTQHRFWCVTGCAVCLLL